MEWFGEGFAAARSPPLQAMPEMALQTKRAPFAESPARRNSAPRLQKKARKKARLSEVRSGPRRAASFERYFPRRAAYQISSAFRAARMQASAKKGRPLDRPLTNRDGKLDSADSRFVVANRTAPKSPAAISPAAALAEAVAAVVPAEMRAKHEHWHASVAAALASKASPSACGRCAAVDESSLPFDPPLAIHPR